MTSSLHTFLDSVFPVQCESEIAEIRGYGSRIEKLRRVVKAWNVSRDIGKGVNM